VRELKLQQTFIKYPPEEPEIHLSAIFHITTFLGSDLGPMENAVFTESHTNAPLTFKPFPILVFKPHDT
jgi:hypothetical protein